MTRASQAPLPPRKAPPSEAEVRAALDRMASDPEFGASERRLAFLRFVVEETLAGRAHQLKGFTIANAVYGRDESFDSRTDPVVRLEARRLRQDLDSYYVGPGAGDPVRIAIPKGGYAPVFEARAEPLPIAAPPEAGADGIDPTPAPAARRWPAVLVAVLALAALGLLWALWSGAPRTDRPATAALPKLAILPFEALDLSETTGTLSAGLGSELIQDLRGFETVRLYAPRSAEGLTETLAGAGEPRVPAYVVTGKVLTEGSRASVLVQLLALQTGEVVWSNRFDLALDVASIIDVRDRVTAEVAAAIGQSYGPLAADIRHRTREAPPPSLESYLCVLQAYGYRRSFEPEDFAQALACLEAAVTRTPSYASAWAMLGWLHLDAGRFQFVPPGEVADEYTAALAAAERAHALDTENLQALQALASIHHYLGNYAQSERFGRMALARAPHDPETLAQVGWRLAVRGNFDEGAPLMQRAIDRTIDPPGWYYHLPSMDAFIGGDTRSALEMAERAAAKGTQYSQFLIAVSAAALGDTERTRAALVAMAAIPELADPAAFMRSHGATDEIVDTMMEGYTEARSLAPDVSPETEPEQR